MLRNYFKIAWRNLSRRKAHTAINVGGLAIGIASSLVLFTVIRYELSYDRFQPGFSRIYHIASQRKNADGISFGEGIPFPAYDALQLAIPQVATGALYSNYQAQVTVLDPRDPNSFSNKKFLEETGLFFSDPKFFSVFHYRWLFGSPQVLQKPDMAVLTKKMAEKYFGSWQAAIGNLLRLDNTATVKVAGILDNVPLNTDFPLALVASYETMKKYPATYGYNTDFGNVTSDFQAFMLLPPGVSPSGINKQLEAFSNEHYNKNQKNNDAVFNFLQPLRDVHFDKRIGNFGDHITSKSTLWTLGLIGLFIILMACINFINLSTAQAAGRSREIGIKKVLGSNKKQLFWQIMGETFIIAAAALVIAAGIALLCLPYLKHVASIREDLSLFTIPSMCFLLSVGIFVTIFAGTYPSLIVAGFKPILALKNKITSATVGGISLRRGLVVTQFAISQILIIGTMIAVGQMNYVQNADLGFNKEAVLVLNSNVDSLVNIKQPAFKQDLLSIQGVQSVSFSSDVPSSENNNSGNFSYDHRPDEKFDLYRKFADEDFFKTYGLSMVAGRAYEKSDTAREVVVNETLVRRLGVKDPAEVLGHSIRISRVSWCTIVGVVRDFKTNSLREAIKPTVLAERNKRYYFTGIKISSSHLQATMAQIEKKWNQYFPEYVYTPTFMDQRINNFYQEENQLSLLYKIFAGIAIFISCLGLYGLVSFMAIQKTREVGIRKVLGASIASIILLFSKEFTILILVAFAVATPVAYYMMNSWLNNFAYRIYPGLLIFGLAMLLSILIAWITVGYQSIKAALTNPVKSLRTE